MYTKNKEKCLTCKMEKTCVCNKIEEIDNIIMSWRFSMCITCAWQCKGKNLTTCMNHQIIVTSSTIKLFIQHQICTSQVNSLQL